MENLEDVALLCQQEAAYHEKRCTRRGMPPERAARHQVLASQFRRAAEISRAALMAPLPSSDTVRNSTQADGDRLFHIDPYDLTDLPSDLVSELTIRADQDDAKLIQLLRIAKRPLSINELMVGLYRKFDEKAKRTTVNARLYRMQARDEVTQHGKGIYGLPEWQSAEGSEGGGP